jgi:hypothetical protein
MRLSCKIIPVLFLFLMVACTEEEACIGCNLNPKVRIKFETASLRSQTDTQLTLVKAGIKLLADSLQQELSEESRNILQSELTSLRLDSLRLSEEFALFRSNRIRINEIEAPGSVGLEQFQDTVVLNFAMPVDMKRDTTTFYFSYHGFLDTLQVHYEREVVQNLEGVRMKLRNIQVNRAVTTFDSIRVQCNKRECSNDKTTIFIYP